SARSDTDTSRADGSVAGDKVAESKPLKKLTAKPVSFAKYSVPKVIAASAAAKGLDKAATPTSSTASISQAGRPRLVAKTTSSLQSSSKPYKTASPDPMQVWNKNRATPQPSTKHLTDEELKQQYGIHLTSRIQADGDGKEAKWADIDDDEDDWAPETIEWNDGTKSTLTPAEAPSQTAQKPTTSSAETAEKSEPAAPPKITAPHFASSVGPNATVLKLGASAERHQAQKATLQSKGPSERPSFLSSKTGPAPTPAKSPWAPLPPVEKVSPVAINPQLSMPPPNRMPPSHAHNQGVPSMAAPSPAQEISADDFNRTWRESQPGHPRELYMPSSGRYEAVPDSRRRMSRNDQNFRAPAVLQRPSHIDPHAPAEPSAAFQTHRTSTDQARRRASSTVSGGSGQFGRRMSIRSGEAAPPVFETREQEQKPSMPPPPKEEPPAPSQPPTYQAHGTSEASTAGPVPAAGVDFEAQRAQQRALMREKVELARRRKIEEEERLEAEKQERIRAKLASLGLDPDITKKKTDNKDTEEKKEPEQPPAVSAPSAPPAGAVTHSPPKPPQPLASGEPQQYGMMKVHPMDSVKKLGTAISRPVESQRLPARTKVESSPTQEPHQETSQAPSPLANGVRGLGPEMRRTSGQEAVGTAEPSPKLPKPSSVTSDARSGWGDVRHDHRQPQSGNLWGLPNNKSLGNGTFDQGLAGYAPQDLSRTSSTTQGWMNNRTPHAGRSPQTQYVNHAPLADSRSFPYQSVASPDQGSLAVDSEVDSLLPTTKPAPIAPPQSQPSSANNSFQNNSRPQALDAWSNFHQVARQQERAEDDKFHRDLMARREEEARTGVRQGPQYSFNETWKQVHVGDSAEQRHIANISQSAVPASSAFGAVRSSMPGGDIGSRTITAPAGRGSRFFPHHVGGHHAQDRRAFTYSHPELPRTPSPPPAEEYSSLHPAFDGDSAKPVVHFPREKAVVKLPPALPPTPPSPEESQPTGAADSAPMTWAARVSRPPPAGPSASGSALRTVSTPIVQNPSWQERFNGLLGKKSSPVREAAHPVDAHLAVTSSTREPLEVQHSTIKSAASVSLPSHTEPEIAASGDGSFATTKNVEDEDDLFEDREPGSLPVIHFPKETPMILPYSPSSYATRLPQPAPVDPFSCHPFMVSNLHERHAPPKPQYALIRFPWSTKPIKKDIPLKGAAGNNHGGRNRFNGGGSYAGKNSRYRGGPRSRQVSKAQAQAH
ncbi:hypothetical protein ABEF94_000189, partial [Exophiala dermatitidis]